LPVIDSLELAIVHATATEDKEEAFDKLLEGIELTYKKILDVFKNHGIEPVEHDEFNPEFHQAVQHVQSEEHEDGAIVDIYQKGYTLKGRVIRPSMVTINKK
jgi:molecular chaperone GrpE